ncbi:hypothetical protein I6A84_18185 [Frankia sp. CNm7]|uniref:Uncharacterized protein n=1 Tax=Frankia nepalensis TaxID=1836974 RepID=A0A937RIA9_9ACTN|nr:hypothetical protein [Frankia nepalensis]MBL7497182.1 hypothetical protein [Frankia nepalensis]MBL7516229.1 hypothetical protein [Frankia nepalensis]MBL7519970.1 hypothetical protein [Frankia nepalensis]MBL7626888.1 hypothetical protein [Frankia nepalensis]
MNILDRLHLRRHGGTRRRPAVLTAGGHKAVRGWAKERGGSPEPDTGLAGMHTPPAHEPRVRSWAKEPGGNPEPDTGVAGMHTPPAHAPHVRPWAKEPGGNAPAGAAHEEDVK